MNTKKTIWKTTCWVLLHLFTGFILLQSVPALQGAAYSNLVPIKPCDYPLTSASATLPPNLMILIDTSGSMEEDTNNVGLRLGADDPRSKMSILKRVLSKLISKESVKNNINIGLATYNQSLIGGNAAVMKYDYDFLYADSSQTLETAADPATDPAPTGVTRDISGQYHLNGTYTLIGPFIPITDYNTGIITGDFGDYDAVGNLKYHYLWTSSTQAIPGTSSNYNADGTWHAHDDAPSKIAGALDPDNASLSLKGAFVNNDYWYNSSPPTPDDTYIDADPNATPSKHRIHIINSTGLQVADSINPFDRGWYQYVQIKPDTTIATTNPGMPGMLALLRNEMAGVVDDATLETGDSSIDNPYWTPTAAGGTQALWTGLVARGNTPLVDSMQCAYNYFNALNNAGKTNKSTTLESPPAANLSCTTISPVIVDSMTIFPTPPPQSCRKNYLLIITDGKDSFYKSTTTPTANTAIDSVMLGTQLDHSDGLIGLGVKVMILGYSVDPNGWDQVLRIATDSDMDLVDSLVGGDAATDDDTLVPPIQPYRATSEPTLVASLEEAFNAIVTAKYATTGPILATNPDIISGHTSTDFWGNSPVRVNQNMLVTPYAELPKFQGHVAAYRVFDYNISGAITIGATSAGVACPGATPCRPQLLWDAGERARSRSLVLTSVSSGGLTPTLSKVEFFPDDATPGGVFATDYSSLINGDNMAEGVTLADPINFSHADWNTLIRWVRDSYGLEKWTNDPTLPKETTGAMGSPILGSPAVVSPPIQDPPLDADYITFAEQQKNRPTMVYQAADDGMIHAIVGGMPNKNSIPPVVTFEDGYTDAEDYSHYWGGDELWAYIPHGILKHLVRFGSNQDLIPQPSIQRFKLVPGYLVGQDVAHHRFFINGDIVTADIKIGTPLEWKTIIMGGYGPGNEGFWCLDVTNPTQTSAAAGPRQIWDTDTAWSATERATLGLTYSTPRIGKIKWKDTTTGDITSKYVAFVGSGYHEDRVPADDSANRGRTFYIIDVENGKLLYRYTVDDVNSTASGYDNENKLVGSVSTIDENLDGYIDDAYIGDLEGRVWKFAINNGSGTVQANCSSPSTNACSYNGTDTPVPFFFDDDPVLNANQMQLTGNPDQSTGKQPIVIRPAVTLQFYSDPVGGVSEYAPLVFFGTGGDPCPTMGATRNFVDGFIDPDLIGEISPKGKRFCTVSKPLFTLSANEQLSGNPVVQGTKAYVTTFIPSTDACRKGQGYIYVIDFGGCLTSTGWSSALPSSDITDLMGTAITPGSTGQAIGSSEGAPAGIAAGPGGVYVLGEGGTIVAVQGGASNTAGTGPNDINPQQKVGTSGQIWREEER